MNSLLILRYCFICSGFDVNFLFFRVKLLMCRVCVCVYFQLFCESLVSSNKATCLQDFIVDALEKFVEESSIPIVTLFNKDPSNHPFVVKYFDSPLAKV